MCLPTIIFEVEIDLNWKWWPFEWAVYPWQSAVWLISSSELIFVKIRAENGLIFSHADEIRASYVQFSPNVRISERVRIYPGGSVTLSLLWIDSSNLNVYLSDIWNIPRCFSPSAFNTGFSSYPATSCLSQGGSFLFTFPPACRIELELQLTS